MSIDKADCAAHKKGPIPLKRQKTEKGNITTQELYKQPTNQELNSLKQTENLFHSSLFRLQVEELLKEVKVKNKYQIAVTEFLTSLKSFLFQLPDEAYTNINESFEADKEICFPLRHRRVPKEKVDTFHFSKPSAVEVIGGFPLELATCPNINVDLAIEMPKVLFKKSDRLNQSYHYKRAIYLVCLARKMKDSRLCVQMEFSCLHGDNLKPILLVKPEGKRYKKITFVFLPNLPSDCMKEHCFSPSQNNIESSWFFDNKEKFASCCNAPTPKYNASILMDMTYKRYLQYCIDALENSESIKDGIILLKVWLHQRELDVGQSGISGFIVSMYTIYLLQTKKINRLTSSYQLARNVWLQLKQSDWTTNGISMCQTAELDKRVPSLMEFHAAYEVVFVDPSGYVNLCANMSAVTFYRVKHEAELALEALDACGSNSFDVLFMTSVPFLRKFDHFVCLHKSLSLKAAVKKLDLHQSLVDSNGDYVTAAISKIIEILRAALGGRLKLVDVHRQAPAKWPVSKRPPSTKDTFQLLIGFLLDPNLYTSVLDKGPSADSVEAKEFRDFWGDLSQLRRFHDSSICEAVVWPADNIAERRMVCQQVVRHVLQRHADVHDKDYHYVGGILDSLLCPKVYVSSIHYGTGEEETVDFLRVYDVLAKKLRNISGLVLPISSVHGISSAFRCTEVFPQLPTGGNPRLKEKGVFQLLDDDANFTPSFSKPHIVILNLESSSKWPNDLDAISHLKTAFHIKLADLLHQNESLLCCAHPGHVDLFYEGFVFRLVVFSPHELTAIRTVHSRTGAAVIQDTEESNHLEAISVVLPKITASLHGLHLHHGCYGATCRLSKRWIASQLLANHVPDICIDLIVAQLFLSPYPYTPPQCPQVGFLRFLQFIVSHDWSSVPLIINLNNEFKKETVIDIQNRFTAHRSMLPAMFIATPFDAKDSCWTKRHPSLQILHRLVTVAQESIKTVEAGLVAHSLKNQCKVAFRPPLEPYDVIIHLETSIINTEHLAVDAPSNTGWTHKKFKSADQGALPVIDFNPALLYLKELRETFDHVALFFYDPYGGSCIAVIWKPFAFLPHQFKIADINGMILSDSTFPVGNEIKVTPNAISIIEDFKRMGHGLVVLVEVRSEKWKIA